MNEWICVKDESPKGKYFLVTDGKEVCLHCWETDQNISGEYITEVKCSKEDICKIYHWNITHWMPLPEPPTLKEIAI